MLLFNKFAPVYVKLRDRGLLERGYNASYVSRIWLDSNGKTQYDSIPLYVTVNGLVPVKDDYTLPLLFFPVEFMEIENKYILNRGNGLSLRVLEGVELYGLNEASVLNTPLVINLLLIKNYTLRGLLSKYEEYVSRAVELFYNNFNFPLIKRILKDNWDGQETSGVYFYIRVQGLPVPITVSQKYKHLPSVFDVDLQDYSQVVEFIKHTQLGKKKYGITSTKAMFRDVGNELFFVGDGDTVYTYIYNKNAEESIIISPDGVSLEEFVEVLNRLDSIKFEDRRIDLMRHIKNSKKVSVLKSYC